VIDPRDNSFRVLDKWSGGDIRGGPLVSGKHLYFYSGSTLVRYTLP
jgi:hypothetical protein